jgi:two-component system response regulator HydG
MLVSDGQDAVELARIIAERARVHYKLGEYDLSQADCESCLDILLGQETGIELIGAYNCMGAISNRKGDSEKGLEYFRSALTVARVLDDREQIGTCLNNLGLACKNLGRWSEAEAYLEEALKIAEEIGQHLQKGIRLSNLAVVYSKRGLWKKAYRCWTEARGILARIGNRWELASVYLGLGHYYLTFRDFKRAEECYVSAMKQSSDNCDLRTSALSFECLGDVYLASDRIDSARRCYLEALEIADQIAPEGDVVAEVKRRLADVEVREGNYEAAIDHALDSIRVALAIGDIFERGCALRSKACAEFHLGEWEKARASFAKAINLLSALGEKKELGIAYLAAGQLLSSQPSSFDLAADYLGEAVSIFERIGMGYEAGMGALGLGRIAAARGDIEACHAYAGKIRELFDDELPDSMKEAVEKIERDADEHVSRLSVSESNDMASFNSIVGRILAVDGEAQKLEGVLDACLNQTCGERGIILLKRNGVLKPLACRNITEDESSAMIPALTAMLKMTEYQRRPLISNKVDGDKRLGSLASTDAIRGAVMCVPLMISGESCGCLYLDTGDGSSLFSKSDAEFTVALMGIVKSMVSEAKLRRFVQEARFLRSKLETTSWFQGIITQNKKMLEILESVEFLCESSTTVLIEGETGTGKEMLARAIHLSGDRKDRPFVTIDCSALANEIIESELFGHLKGAFTDARADRTGLFESADGGTVFLDEIDKTSKKFQQRLLQVVDKREFKPVGSTISRKVDFRLICATNRDVAKEVEAGRFLEDLYYRLKVISLRVPALSERRDDIPLLAEHFLQKYTASVSKTVPGFSSSAMDLLVSYSWPGNVRQLEHEVERAVTFVEDGESIVADLFSDELRDWGKIVATDGKRRLAEATEQLERQMIKDALKRFNGNRTKASRSLGLSRRGLLNKIQRYHLTT